MLSVIFSKLYQGKRFFFFILKYKKIIFEPIAIEDVTKSQLQLKILQSHNQYTHQQHAHQ